MKISFWQMFLWVQGFVLNVVLVGVLFYKRHYRIVPWFTAWITAEAFFSVFMFVMYRVAPLWVAVGAYWVCDLLDVALQLAVVWEIARYLFVRFGAWLSGTRTQLWIAATGSLLMAGALAWQMTPAAETPRDALLARFSLFTTVLVCVLLTAVVTRSRQLGTAMRSHVMKETYGFILWMLVAFVTDTLHSYWRTMGQFTLLENVRIAVFQGSLVYWVAIFCRPEPKHIYAGVDVEGRLKELATRLGYGESDDKSSSGALK